MTPKEFLNKYKVIRTSYDVSEVDLLNRISDCYWLDDKIDNQKRIKIDYYGNPYIDGYRTWTLGLISLDDVPSIIFQEACRDGRDFQNHWILNFQKYKEIIQFILFFIKENFNDKIINMDIELGNNITNFNGSNLDDILKRNEKIIKGKTIRKLSDWIQDPHTPHCSMRIVEGGNPNKVSDRRAFIEKTPRVFDGEKWIYGNKGSGKLYGKYPPSRKWCDDRLKELGYILPEDSE